jgi:hypothetical protein
MRLRRRTTGLGDDVFDTMAPGVHRIMQEGVSLEQAMELAVPALHEALNEVAPRVARDLVRRAPRMLRQHGRLNRRFERRLRKHWGHALDRFYAIVVCAEEVGHELHRAYRERTAEELDAVFEALIGLLDRLVCPCLPCRSEGPHLLSGGFPLGALARSRTLHELAVITIVIAEYGREEEHADLADRFLQHAWIARYRDALVYQENHEALGHEPLGDEDMARMQQQHDLLIAQYGTAYGKQYGWAVGLNGQSSPPDFKELERLADLSHVRWHYKQQSHEVHADASGWESNVLEQNGQTYLTTDRVQFGLAEPAHLALISLHQCAASLFGGAEGDIRTQDVLALKALAHLVNEAGDILGRAEEAVLRADERC